MNKSAARLVFMLLLIVFFLFSAIYGIGALGIKGVFQDGGIRKGLDLVGGSTIVFGPQDDTYIPSSGDMSSVMAMLRSRLDNLGYSEATVQQAGTNHIRVEIPSITDPEQAVQMLGATAKLTFRDYQGNTVMDGADIQSASAAYGSTGSAGVTGWYVSLKIKSTSVQKWADLTARVAALPSGSNYIAIYLDDTQQSAPTVSEQINSDSAVITGSFTQTQAQWLASVINVGQLPFALTDISLSSTGPTLGAEAYNTSLMAGGIGILCVMLFLILFYRLPGFVASIALVGYTAMIGLILVITKANLSLPGIAGVILSVGMAVDANIIIFERIKDELRGGKTLKAALKNGFHRAYAAIIDSHVTTLLASAVLYFLGTGPVQGFAVTLFIGVALSLISAVLITRSLMTSFAGLDLMNHTFLYGVKESDVGSEKPLAGSNTPAKPGAGSGKKSGKANAEG